MLMDVQLLRLIEWRYSQDTIHSNITIQRPNRFINQAIVRVGVNLLHRRILLQTTSHAFHFHSFCFSHQLRGLQLHCDNSFRCSSACCPHSADRSSQIRFP